MGKPRVSKLSMERITKIVRLIRQRGAISMAFLQERLDVSEASIKRDIEFLRSRLGCPLDWDASQRGYVIRDERAEGGRFELPGVWFDSAEVVALLTMLHLVEGVQPGLLEEHVAPLKSRLRQMLAEGAKSAKKIESKFKLIHFAPRQVESKHFQVIAGALLEGKRLNLRYWNRDRKEESQRVISPQKLVHYRENWSLDAWCHKQKGLRIFALESVMRVQVLDEAAIEVAADVMDKHFRSGYGIFAGEATERARLRFSAQRAQWVSKETWHHEQTSHFEEDGSFVMEVPYSNDRELLMDILRHSPEVEVLAPATLRQRLLTLLQAAAERNVAPKPDSVVA